MTRQMIELLLRHIAEKSERESRFLNPSPRWMLDASGLLLFIGKMGALPEEEVARMFNAERERIEATKH